jgi:hypothetical protein
MNRIRKEERKKRKRTECSSVVMHSPSICEALASIPRTTKKCIRRNNKERELYESQKAA